MRDIKMIILLVIASIFLCSEVSSPQKDEHVSSNFTVEGGQESVKNPSFDLESKTTETTSTNEAAMTSQTSTTSDPKKEAKEIKDGTKPKKPNFFIRHWNRLKSKPN
ncbi:hypothetical protein H312_00205 [Anncaliia algerae PRA339]|uniref:RxLR effector protein n=1 Tax=Anncaliia algerae PRA339 TaxID=1288291 RepID=A0A059F654_9MICR|nr:hypothetical protein H312_00205 [Anncaliia algerae PRA339]